MSAAIVRIGFELGLAARRALVVVHVLLAALVTGGLAALLVLLRVRHDVIPGGAGRAAFVLLEYLVTPAGLAFVFTGLAFGLFTRWGFARYAWVMAKWLGTIVLGVALIAALGPAVATLAALADTGIRAADVATYESARGAAFAWATVLLALVVALIGLSVFKPGRARRPATGTFAPRRQLAGALAGIVLAAMLVAQWAMLERLRHVPVAAPPVTLVRAGQYQGRATIGGFEFGVELVASDGRIDSLRVTGNRDGLYPALGARVTRKMVDAQSGCVDWVSGASTTSRAIQAAAADALRQAVTEPTAVARCAGR